MGGGGVVAEIFRDLNYRIGFSGGGGSSRNVPPKQINHIPSIPAHFWYIFGPPPYHPPFMDTRGNSGTLPMSDYTFKPRNNINSFRKKNIYQNFGGGMAPLAPPGYATALSALHIHHRCSMKMETMNVATSKSTLKHKLQVTIYECNYLISDTVIYYVSALIWGITCGCRAKCVSKWTRSSTKLYDSQMSSSCFKGSPPTESSPSR